jgi:transcriptional regulator with XRE-family HTH domain
MREWRLARGMLQGELAKAVGSSKSLISRYENGLVGMSFDLQLRVMQALNIMPNEFFMPPPKRLDDPKRLQDRQQYFSRKNREQDGE